MGVIDITTTGAPAPSGGYSQGIVAGGFLYLSGQGPFRPDGSQVRDSVESQVRQVFANLEAVAQAAGRSLSNAVRVGVYLSDLRHFDEMDRVYRQILSEPRPARTTIQTDLVGFDVEIDAIVFLGD
jgi:2-iminobutanoate/2-iminopropanoate deaminase